MDALSFPVINGDDMGFGWGEAIGLGSKILGGIGGGKNKGVQQLPSGFASLPQAQKDTMQGAVWDKVLAYLNGQYQGLPMRRLNAEDMDPVFGSRARQDYQNMIDAEAAKKYVGASAPVQNADSGAMDAQNAAIMRFMGSQALQSGDYRSPAARIARDPNATDADLAKLFKATGGNLDQRGVMANRGKNAMNTDTQSSLRDLVVKYLIGMGAA